MQNQPIPKNLSNDEYLALLSQQNAIKKQRELSKERVMEKRVQQREQGFNLYMGGANRDRIKDQKNRETLGNQISSQDGGTARSNSRGAGQRRQWRSDASPEQKLPQKTYHNPFEIIGQEQSNINQAKKPPNGNVSQRKIWGQQQPVQLTSEGQKKNLNFLDNSSSSDSDSVIPATKVEVNTVQEAEEESYSDSFEEINQTIESTRKQDVADLLMTATAEQLDVLKQSLNNFRDLNKQKAVNVEDEYIEEIFEDEGEDIHSSMQTSAQSQGASQQQTVIARFNNQLEEQKKAQQQQYTTRNQVGAGKRTNRPISATYNLAQHQFGQPSGIAIHHQPTNSQSLRQIDRAQVIQAVNQENKNLQAASAQSQLLLQQNNQQKALNTNPFRQRPVSHVVPTRPPAQDKLTQQQIKTMDMSTKDNQVSSTYNPSMVATTFSRDEDQLGELNFKTQNQSPQKKVEQVTVEDLLSKIYKLDDSQRHQLFNVLKQLESKGSLSGSKLNEGLQKFLSPTQPQPRNQAQKVDQKQQEQKTRKIVTRNELVLRVISTLGHPHVCGLTEIELFDHQAQKIQVAPACVLIRNQGKGPKISADKLINGQKLTTNERHMWMGYLPLQPLQLEIHIYFEKDIQLGGLKIWNYNKSVLDCTKGVSQIQILVNQELKWEGRLEACKGYLNQDFAKKIVLSNDTQFKLPSEVMPETTPKQLETKHVEPSKTTLTTQQLPVENTMQQIQAKIEQRQPNDSQRQDKPIWFEKSDIPTVIKPEEQKKSQRQDLSPYANHVKNAISSAVNSVQKVIQQTATKDSGRAKRPLNQQLDESLDSLDFFKITSMGRLQNKESSIAQQQRKNQNQLADQSLISKDSNQKRGHLGPQVLKNPFPEDFAFPSPAQSNKKQSQPQKMTGGFVSEAQKPESSHGLDNIQVKQLAPSRIPIKQQSSQIPETPSGQKLQFNILDTWGDMNYLGLTGIEVFDTQGKQLNIQKITACPPDINVLQQYGNDPRVVANLVDGNYFTNDDLNVWLTPFTSGEDHTITMELEAFSQISMIRVWNYNKSRIHSYRGARQITIELDDKLIFSGEIKKAPGNTKDPEACCEIILFTNSDQILQKIDDNDWLNNHDIAMGMDDTQRINEFQKDENDERPLTATKKFTSTQIEELQFQLQQQQSKPTSLFDERPQTSAIIQSQRIGQSLPTELKTESENKTVKQTKQKFDLKQQIDRAVKGRRIWINITESWGDLFYVGLNGIEVLNVEGDPIVVTVNPDSSINSRTTVTAKPRDMNSIAGHTSDHRTLEKLFNDRNNTMDDRNMWLIPYNKGEDHTILIDLGEQRAISGIKFYNYNKSYEDSLRGVRQAIIKIDDQLMTPKRGVTIRKAPGFVYPDFDFGQVISMPYKDGWNNEQIIPVQKSLAQKQSAKLYQEYDTIPMPMGLTFKFNFYSTHGDLYYIGLNGVQLYDQNGNPLLNTQAKMCAIPQDIKHLPGMHKDIRTIDKLVNGKNDTLDDNNMWLAPFKNTKSSSSALSGSDSTKREPNFVCFMFESPTAVSAIQLWNYMKTDTRGVNEFEIEVDGCQIFRGFLKKAGTSAVVFGYDVKRVERMYQLVNFDPNKRQNVVLVNEKKIVSDSNTTRQQQKEKFVFDEQARPQTNHHQ